MFGLIGFLCLPFDILISNAASMSARLSASTKFCMNSMVVCFSHCLFRVVSLLLYIVPLIFWWFIVILIGLWSDSMLLCSSSSIRKS